MGDSVQPRTMHGLPFCNSNEKKAILALCIWSFTKSQDIKGSFFPSACRYHQAIHLPRDFVVKHMYNRGRTNELNMEAVAVVVAAMGAGTHCPLAPHVCNQWGNSATAGRVLASARQTTARAALALLTAHCATGGIINWSVRRRATVPYIYATHA